MSDSTPQIFVVDCSLEKPPADGFTDKLKDDAIALLTVGKADAAMQVLAEATRLAALPPVAELRNMDADEIDQHTANQTAIAEQATAARAGALEALTSQRDSLLAASDWRMTPPAALPTDLPDTVRADIAKTASAWATYRQLLRDYPATVTDPLDPPPFPTPPA